MFRNIDRDGEEGGGVGGGGGGSEQQVLQVNSHVADCEPCAGS